MKPTWTLTTIGVALCATVQLASGQATPPPAGGAAPPPPPAEHKVTAPDGIKWGDAPPSLPKGAKLAVLYGDPSKEGLFIVRAKMPANYKIAPHWHPTDENVTVLSGSFAIGMGDKLDAKTKAMPAGTFFSMPAKMHHFAFTTKETVIELSAMGPFVLNYINPDDDPSKAAAPPAPKK